MFKKITIAASLMFIASAYSQVTFEELNADSGTVLNGKNGTLEYSFDDVTFPVFWDTSYGGFWSSGWAISTKLDSTIAVSDYSSQLYLAKPKFGFAESKAFAVGQNGSSFYSSNNMLIRDFYISNSVYTYNSMKLGDAFGKKFGGTTGNDNDSLICVIQSYFVGNLISTQRIPLADFRFEDSTQDYIVKEWVQVFMLNSCDSVVFNLESSDNSSWGMNTPSFFVLDHVRTNAFENIEKQQVVKLSVFPNPANKELVLTCNSPVKTATISTITGTDILIANGKLGGIEKINISTLAPGVYIVNLSTEIGQISAKFIKE